MKESKTTLSTTFLKRFYLSYNGCLITKLFNENKKRFFFKIYKYIPPAPTQERNSHGERILTSIIKIYDFEVYAELEDKISKCSFF